MVCAPGFWRGERGSQLPADQDTALLHGDVDGLTLEMVAHPQGEEGGEGAVVQGLSLIHI